MILPVGVVIPLFLLASSVLFYVYRTFWCLRYFKRLGIPGPQPHFLFGNLRQLWRHDRHLILQQWAKQFGPIYGVYEGSSPVLVVADVEAVEQICLKQSGSFGGRHVVDIQPDPDKRPNDPWSNIFMAQGDHWRRPRLAASPFFSSHRLRMTTPLLEKNCKKFHVTVARLSSTGAVDPSSSPSMIVVDDVASICQRFALQFLGESAFSIDLKLLDSEQEAEEANCLAAKHYGEWIFASCRQMFNLVAHDHPFVFKLIAVFPCLVPVVEFAARLAVHYCPPPPTTTANNNNKLGKGTFEPVNALLGMMSAVVTSRRNPTGSNTVIAANNTSHQQQQQRDLVQMLSDAFVTRLNLAAHGLVLERRPFLSDEQLLVNLMGFLIAGYETSGTTLAICCHLLATHPRAQRRLYDEIKAQLAEPDGEERLRDYDTLMSLEYLNGVVHEAMRLYPAAVNLITRQPAEDTVICGFHVPTSLKMVQIDAFTVNHDPELWGPVDPAEFYPERHLADYPTANRPASAFLSFGVGARQCIGIRLVMFEIKFAIVHLLRHYELLLPSSSPSSSQSDDSLTNKRLPVKVDSVMMMPTVKLSVALRPRQQQQQQQEKM